MAKENVANSASDNMGADDWLDDGDFGGGFFKIDFKKDDEYRVWLHPRSSIRVLWRVVWYYTHKDKVKLYRWNSMESRAILEKFRFKSDDGSGAHEHTPQVDPFLKLIDWVDVQIVAGTIGLTDEIFKFEPEDDGEEKIIHAGGFTGLFQSKEVKEDPAAKKAIRAIGVRLDEAFKENANAQEETVFIVIDNADPGAGPQIATVGRGLAKAWKDEINRRKLVFAKDKSQADPFSHPVCFVWTKDTSGDFAKYGVVATQDELTEEIKAAFAEDVPDTTKIFEKSNVAVLRKSFEENWCHDHTPNWDEIFAAAFEVVKGTAAAELPESFKPSADDDDEEEEKPAKKPAPKAKAEAPKATKPVPVKEKAPEPEPETTEDLPVEENAEGGEEVTTCDKCDGVLGDEVFESDPVICPHCGAKYVYDEAKGEFLLQEEVKPAVAGSRRPK